MKLRVLDLFSGIGGFSLGLERTGFFETVAFCEIEKYPQKVLAKHWPEVPIYEDVRKLTAKRLISDGIGNIQVITAGFPCQDVSVAGAQAGIEGERSGLWSECAHLLGDIQPKYAIFENVTNLLAGGGGGWFKRILWDISCCGYDAEWYCIPSAAVGAHHNRGRVWIIAYPKGERVQGLRPCGEQILLAHEIERLLMCCREDGGFPIWKTEPDICRVVDGIPSRAHRVKALGNSVTPQIPELIGRALINAGGI